MMRCCSIPWFTLFGLSLWAPFSLGKCEEWWGTHQSLRKHKLLSGSMFFFCFFLSCNNAGHMCYLVILSLLWWPQDTSESIVSSRYFVCGWRDHLMTRVPHWSPPKSSQVRLSHKRPLSHSHKLQPLQCKRWARHLSTRGESSNILSKHPMMSGSADVAWKLPWFRCVSVRRGHKLLTSNESIFLPPCHLYFD